MMTSMAFPDFPFLYKLIVVTQFSILLEVSSYLSEYNIDSLQIVSKYQAS
jgi:hypothetical protein